MGKWSKSAKTYFKNAFDLGVNGCVLGFTFEYYYNETYKDTEQ